MRVVRDGELEMMHNNDVINAFLKLDRALLQNSLFLASSNLFSIMATPPRPSLDSLFSRSPVLPVDATLSLARYVRQIRQTQEQATQPGTTVDRSALLHIRVLQLICKTLPSHPDYQLAENAPLVKECRTMAHASFAEMEKLSAHFGDRRRVRRRKRVEISHGVVELFERVMTDGETSLGLLAGRLGEHDIPARVAALVIPACDEQGIRYMADVTQLLEIKDLVCMGVVCVKEGEEIVTGLNRVLIEGYQRDLPEAVAVVVGGVAERRYEAYVPGARGMEMARHVDWRADGLPAFKMYDLRPLAVARDRQTVEEGV